MRRRQRSDKKRPQKVKVEKKDFSLRSCATPTRKQTSPEMFFVRRVAELWTKEAKEKTPRRPQKATKSLAGEKYQKYGVLHRCVPEFQELHKRDTLPRGRGRLPAVFVV